jgi:hypothetical protein
MSQEVVRLRYEPQWIEGILTLVTRTITATYLPKSGAHLCRKNIAKTPFVDFAISGGSVALLICCKGPKVSPIL